MPRPSNLAYRLSTIAQPGSSLWALRVLTSSQQASAQFIFVVSERFPGPVTPTHHDWWAFLFWQEARQERDKRQQPSPSCIHANDDGICPIFVSPNQTGGHRFKFLFDRQLKQHYDHCYCSDIDCWMMKSKLEFMLKLLHDAAVDPNGLVSAPLILLSFTNNDHRSGEDWRERIMI